VSEQVNLRIRPIDIAPVQRPDFNDLHVGDLVRWTEDNLANLARYWFQLGKALGFPEVDTDVELRFWIRIQHDQQLTRRERLSQGDPL
jgi:hypothetical protein